MRTTYVIKYSPTIRTTCLILPRSVVEEPKFKNTELVKIAEKSCLESGAEEIVLLEK
ncbi:13903_t:CDS:2 [Gigaspora margarita]|uniref:13903_t:CDS:1 n=1 Tax=Gigaspora margarita TaxID=4874 RepID=A0ABN7UYE2_GIGMA|nr:13903_t:CDS:2 [Gigaspora margarita]